MSNKSSRPQNNAPSRKADDFRLINGLPKNAKAKLHAAGILTFDQLAAMSPHEIVAAVAEADSADAETSAERIIREDWIGQAQKLAESRISSKSEASLSSPAHAAKDRVTSFALELKLSPNNEVRQTRVMHVESEAKDAERKWDGWNESGLLGFIADRAGFAALKPNAVEPVAANQLSFTDVSIEERLQQLHAKHSAAIPAEIPALPRPTRTQPTEVVAAPTPSKSSLEVFAAGVGLPSGVVPSGDNYSLKVLFDPTTIRATESDELAYSVTVYAKKLTNGSPEQRMLIAGQSQGSISPKDKLVFDLEGAKLEKGSYRLQAAASFTSSPSGKNKKTTRQNFTAFVEGGLLQVF